MLSGPQTGRDRNTGLYTTQPVYSKSSGHESSARFKLQGNFVVVIELFKTEVHAYTVIRFRCL